MPFFPDEEPISQVLRKWLLQNKKDLVWLADVVDRANVKLGNRQMAIGPSHFLRSDLNENWVKLIWKHSILPYVEEQLFLGEDNKQNLGQFALEVLRSSPADSQPSL